MTFFGLIIILALVALIVLMGWLGWKKRWLIASLLTVPFLAYLAYVEATTNGPPIYEDPYGPMLVVIIVGPIFVGWIAFLLGRFFSWVRLKQLSQK